MTVYWIPGHFLIAGDELADEMAAAALGNQKTHQRCPYTDLKYYTNLKYLDTTDSKT